MELKVFWTDTARFQLEDIFDYYKNKASLKVAKKIISQIVSKVNSIKKHPKTGQIEELLIERSNS